MKTFKQCCDEVALKHGNPLFGVLALRQPEAKIFEQLKEYSKEAAELYAKEVSNEESRVNNIAHKSATISLVKEAVKLTIPYLKDGNFQAFTELQIEILSKLNLND